MRIPFLAFADDIIIFSKTIPACCQEIKNIFQSYCSISEQKVNFNKYAFQLTKKVPHNRKQLIEGILSIANNETSTGIPDEISKELSGEALPDAAIPGTR